METLHADVIEMFNMTTKFAEDECALGSLRTLKQFVEGAVEDKDKEFSDNLQEYFKRYLNELY